MVAEPCPSRGRRTRLPLLSRLASGPDSALVWGGPCGRCGGAHAAALVLAAPGRSEPVRADGRAAAVSAPPSPARVELAGRIVSEVDGPAADRVRLDYLGWRRPALRVPVVPAVASGGRADLGELVADLERRCRRELQLVAESRRIVPPADPSSPLSRGVEP